MINKIKAKILIPLITLFQVVSGFSNNTTIEGKILNYQRDAALAIVEVCQVVYEINDTECFEEYVNEEGLFKIEMEIDFVMEITICYDRSCTQVLIEPGQNNYLEFNDKEHNSGEINFGGDYKLCNEILMDYTNKYRMRFFHFRYVEHLRKRRELPTEEYYEYRLKWFKEEMSFLKNYIDEQEVTDSTFIEWASQNIRYEYGYDLHQHFFDHYNPLIDKLPEWYLKKIEEEVTVNYKGKIRQRGYGMYLHYKLMSLDKACQESEESRELIDKKKGLWEAKMKYLIEHSEGASKDRMLGEKMNNYINQGQLEIVKKYLEEIKDENIKKYIKGKLETKEKEM